MNLFRHDFPISLSPDPKNRTVLGASERKTGVGKRFRQSVVDGGTRTETGVESSDPLPPTLGSCGPRKVRDLVHPKVARRWESRTCHRVSRNLNRRHRVRRGHPGVLRYHKPTSSRAKVPNHRKSRPGGTGRARPPHSRRSPLSPWRVVPQRRPH